MVDLIGVASALASFLTLPLTLGAVVAIPFGGYWLLQSYPRPMAAAVGAVGGLAIALPVAHPAALAGGAAVGAVAGVAAAGLHRRGADVVTGAAAGLVLGRLAGTAPSAYAVMAALAVAVAAVVWKFRRPGLVVSTAVVGSVLPVYAYAAVLSATFDPTLAAVPIFSVGLMGVFAQPLVVEYSDTVAPMIPQRLRSLFGFTESAAVDDAVCPDCERDVDPSADACPHCSASLVGIAGPAEPASAPGERATAAGAPAGATPDPATAPGESAAASSEAAARRGSVPDGAVAVDIACQHCGERPIEELAKGYRVTGFLLAYRITTVQSVGCHGCNRRKLWGMAGKNLLTGWWSITAIVITPFATLYDVGRSLVNRGPTSALAESLNDSGMDYEFLRDADAFDPSRHTEAEFHLRALIRLGCATMLTDGQATKAEATAMRDAAVELYPDYPTDEIERRIRDGAESVTNAVQVARGLSDMLTPAGKEQALQFAAVVAAADDDVDPEEMELLGRIADAMGMSDADVERALTGDAL
ncbi:hypothetical protein G9464_04695 [Halostella sp. JP-L12]|uniref:TerB family tellurite resistance protein n=1 Tax=Halostella TaxID=1843185 RepID=UPI000EF79F02|nr:MULTISPECIES: TerB family tellurite resistance protein [Halostella]NHN46894.1 hypothetical protein [Halostella sp. JP-L12]